jgi:hypothetical protein
LPGIARRKTRVKRAYDPAMHPSCEKMDVRVKPAHDWPDQSPH